MLNEDVTSNEQGPMITLSTLIEKAKKDGYSNNFRIEDEKLITDAGDASFTAEEVKINNFYRFEGESNPEDESILYLIETNTGIRGIVVNAYGPGAETETYEFIERVHKMHKVLHDKKDGK